MSGRVILVSGWAHPASAMSSLADALSNHYDVSCISVAELSSPDHDHADALLAEIGNSRCCLVGWSMGAMVAMEAALRAPNLVEGLVLLSPTARFCSDGEHPGFPPANIRALRRNVTRSPDGTLRAFLVDAVFPALLDDTDINQRVADAMQIGVDLLAAGLDYLARTDLRDKVAKIEAPCLLLHGCEDKIIPARASELLATRLQNARCFLYDACGHDLLHGDRSAVCAAVDGFVTALTL